METTTTHKTCECGCGEPVRRRFLPGHDARLKGMLVRAVASGNLVQRERAAAELLDRGWLHFASVEDLATLKIRTRARNGRFTESRHMQVVEAADWKHLDEAGVTHSHPACGDAEGVLTPERHVSGWLCSTCVHVTDWAERAAAHAHEAWLLKAETVAEWVVPVAS